jgi:hypothetical protein
MWLNMVLNPRCASLSLQSMAIADVYCNACISFFLFFLLSTLLIVSSSY